MQNANELLYGILQVLGRIETNTRQKTATPGAAQPSAPSSTGSISGKLSNIGSALQSFKGVKPSEVKTFFVFMDKLLWLSKTMGPKTSKNLDNVSKSLNNLGAALPGISSGLINIGKLKSKQIDTAIHSLSILWEFMESKGDNQGVGRVNRAIKTFDKMTKSLKEFVKPIKDISLGFAYLGLGILAFAGSIVLTGMILRLGKPSDVFVFLAATVIGVVTVFGVLAFAEKYIKKGISTIKDIGLGFAALSLGIISFALTIKILPMILGSESGGSIAKSLLIMVGIVGAMALMFTVLGAIQPFAKKGFQTIVWMSLGMGILSIAILGLALVAKMLSTGMTFNSDASKDEKDQNKKFIMKGLGTIGLIVLAATATFAMLGIPGFSGIIKSGAITMMLMAGALILMAISIDKLVNVGEKLAGKDIASTLGHLIGGTIEGFIQGLAPLTGGKKGVRGVAEFIKNSAKIFAGTGILMSMSLALSMFAKAITAFAELENMRIIEGYDKDGKPIFGQKVNLTKVSDNITYSISTFLQALITSTDGLTKEKAGAIRRMSRALTGKRGILTAVIQFADAMKVYAEFGEKNEIGYVDFDEKGNEIKKKVAASVVVDNMIGSFLYFTNRLFKKSEEEFGDGEPGISGRQRRRMKRMSKALIGKNGILGAVTSFAETLKMFAEFGADNELPILDAEGKPTGKTLSMENIADNIVKALTTFSDTLATKLENSSAKDAKKAIGKYSGIIEELSKFSESIGNLEKVNDTIANLAKNINDLSISLDNFDTAKISKLSAIQGISVSGSGSSAPSQNPVQATTEKVTAANRSSEVPRENWDMIAASIGQQVGVHVVEAMKKGQIKFEFSPSSPGKGVLTFD